MAGNAEPGRQAVYNVLRYIPRCATLTRMPARIHPGIRLLQHYLTPLGISQNRLARAIGVPPRRINEIVLGKRAISADTAVRLARYFGNDAHVWLQLQADYDIERAGAKLGAALRRIKPVGALADINDVITPAPPAAADGAIRKRILR